MLEKFKEIKTNLESDEVKKICENDKQKELCRKYCSELIELLLKEINGNEKRQTAA